MAEDWGRTASDSHIEYNQNGLSNEYNLNKPISSGPEYITIYDSSKSLQSRILSILMILGVLVFCGVFFAYLFKDNSTEQVQITPNVSAQKK